MRQNWTTKSMIVL